MKIRFVSIVLCLAIVLLCLPNSCASTISINDLEETVPRTGTTFKVLYDIYCKDLPSDVVSYICAKKADTADYIYNNSGSNEDCNFWVVSNDKGCLQAVGYTTYMQTKQQHYIVRDITCLHEHGELIRLTVFYDMDGHYIGNIKWDRTNGTATPSSRCPYTINRGITNLN